MIADLAGVLALSTADRAKLAALLAAQAQGGASGARAFLQAARLLGEAAEPAALDAALPGAHASIPDRVGALVAACFSAVRRRFLTRGDAVTARTALSARAEWTIDAAGAAFGADLHGFLVRLTGEALVRLSEEAATRAPLVRVEVGASLPSSLLAFDLYGDPSRGAELVDRNGISTPMLMPVAFEAQAT